MTIYAISDIHVGFAANAEGLAGMAEYPEDLLLLAGDVADTEAQMRLALELLAPRFRKVVWVPGNHDLWTLPHNDPAAPRGQDRYMRQVDICRSWGVLTPEDPFLIWQEGDRRVVIAPLFVLYDYSFRPADVPFDESVAWATESGILCSDEYLLHSDPFPDKASWCAERCRISEQRLDAIDPALPTIIVNHFPLREDLSHTPAIPRFSIWCGTTRTEDWHRRWNVEVVVSGHLHIRRTAYRDGVRFEEVSLGAPRQWDQGRGVDSYLRRIMPE